MSENIPGNDNTYCYRYNYSSTSTTDYSTPVTDANATTALKAARAAMSDPYNVTPMD